MPIKKRPKNTLPVKDIDKGVGEPTPSVVQKTGGIKRRSEVPEAVIEADVPTLPGELGNIVTKITASNNYGSPFMLASSKRMASAQVRTGILAVDLALGGGWALSRAGMLYGEKSSGKSTTALQSIATMQLIYPDSFAAYVDVEGTLDKAWARKLGVDLDRLIVIEPETGEHAVDLADAVLRAREVSIVITDSIAMLVSMKELDESSEKDTMALQARLTGKYIRRTTNAMIKERARGHKPVLLHLNQFRMKVGLVFGDPRTLPGGKAVEYSTSQQVEIKNKEHVGKDADGNDVVLFNEHNVKITKNKSGGPMKEAAFKLIRLDGYKEKPTDDGMPEAWIDQSKTIFKYGFQTGVISGAPASFEVDGITGKFKGSAAFTSWALENKVLYGEIQDKIVRGFRSRWSLD